MTILATIGAKALYLLFLWLISAAVAAWMADRKGYTERVGLTFGLVLSVVGLAIVLVLPGRPGSAWKEEGPLPRRGRRPGAPDPAVSEAPPPIGSPSEPPEPGAGAAGVGGDGPGADSP